MVVKAIFAKVVTKVIYVMLLLMTTSQRSLQCHHQMKWMLLDCTIEVVSITMEEDVLAIINLVMVTSMDVVVEVTKFAIEVIILN